MNLTAQEAKVACFQNAAAHLAAGGHFLVEMPFPGLRRAGDRFVVFDHSDTHVGIDEYDVTTQRLWSHHIKFLPDGRVQRASPPFRYAWPAELDLRGADAHAAAPLAAPLPSPSVVRERAATTFSS